VSPLAGTLSIEQVAHREDYAAFVLEHAQGPYASSLLKLYALGQEYNDRHFAGRLVPPYVLLSEPRSPQAIGDWSPISGSGLLSQIRIRPSILTGTHRKMRAGTEYAAGRFLYAADILLHEMIHQWHTEVTGQTEDSMHGHGPAFRDMCNQIGRQLGLPPVGTKRQKQHPACNQWPHNVRPVGYYLGAIADVAEQLPAPEPSGPDAGDYGAMFAAALAALPVSDALDVLAAWLPTLPDGLRVVLTDPAHVNDSPTVTQPDAAPSVPASGDTQPTVGKPATRVKRGKPKTLKPQCPHCGSTRRTVNVHDSMRVWCWQCGKRLEAA